MLPWYLSMTYWDLDVRLLFVCLDGYHDMWLALLMPISSFRENPIAALTNSLNSIILGSVYNNNNLLETLLGIIYILPYIV